MKSRAFLRIVFVLAGILAVFPRSPLPAADGKPLGLSECIRQALDRSAVLKGAREGVKGAEAQRKEAFTGFLPKLSTSYGYTRLNEEPFFNFPGMPPAFPPQQITTGTKDNYNWALEAQQPVFAGGRIKANYDASLIGIEVSRTEEQAAVLDVIRDVKEAYYGVLKAERYLDVARQSRERLKAHHETARGFFDVGMIPKSDLLYAEVELANGEQLLLRAENGLEMARSRFNTVLRRGLTEPVLLEDILSLDPFPISLDEALAQGLERRPELKAVELRIEQVRKQIKALQSEYYPQVSAVGNYSRYGDTPSVGGTKYKDQESWYGMLVANWTFWEWGRTNARVDGGVSRERQAIEVQENLRDQVTLEIKNAWLATGEMIRRVGVTQQAIVQAEENYRMNVERYREQVATSTEVLDAQTLLTKAKSDYVQALGDYSIYRARLDRAMGVRKE